MADAKESVPVTVEEAPADAKAECTGKPKTVGAGSTYTTPMHPNGIVDTSSNWEGPLGMEFNPRVSLFSIVLIFAFCIWCMVHTPCKEIDFDGTCSLSIDGDLSKEQCKAIGAGVQWNAEVAAACSGSVNVNVTSEDACNALCEDCASYYPASDGSDKACQCPCPTWSEKVGAHCGATGSGHGDVDKFAVQDLLESYTEAQCNELALFPAVWTDDAEAGVELPRRHNGAAVTAASIDSTDATTCAASGGVWVEVASRDAAPLTGQAAITASESCKHALRGCASTSTGYATEDALDVEFDQDWDANKEFSLWKSWVAAKFNWFYIGSQDVWIVFIAVVYFSKYSSIKLCKAGDEDVPPEYSDASWFSMLFCSGIGVGLFFYGVSEPVYHYADGTNRYNANPALTDEQVAQDAMNLTFFHWGLHGFVVYTQVGLILGIISYRWGLPMTMKSCFYPLLGDKIFGITGDVIDIFSVITTLFGVCTSLGLGVIQLGSGLERLTTDDQTGEVGIKNTTGTQVAIVWFITAIAACSVVSGVKNGIQRLSNIAFVMGLMILFVGLCIGDTWYLLNVFVQSVTYYIQYIIQLGGMTSAFASTPFENFENHGIDLSPDVASSSTDTVTHSTAQENKAWMDWWTLFYWGWWIAWSPFVGTFMAKISKGRTIKSFIFGSCVGPMLFSMIWFSVFGGLGIQMARDADANGIVLGSPEVVAVLETTTLPLSGAINDKQTNITGLVQSSGWVTGGACGIQDKVHACAADKNCEYEYLKDPSLIQDLSGRVNAWDTESCWYDMVLSFGDPDAFMGWFLFVFSMFALVLYFVTSSDSGSLVIDILAANGVEDPPVVQRIFWACMEGLTATALLVAGGKNALNALRAASIVAGLPYTALLCFICTSIWRALQMDAKDVVYDQKKEFKVELVDILINFDMNLLTKFAINTLVPPLQIAQHGNLWYTILSAICWFCFILFHIFETFAHGWWAMGWMSYLMLVLIIADVRGKARLSKGATGNMVEDLFASLLFHGGVLTQLGEEDSGEPAEVEAASA